MGQQQNVQTLAEMWYPAAGGTKPLKVQQNVRIWETASGQSITRTTTSEVRPPSACVVSALFPPILRDAYHSDLRAGAA